MQQQSRKSYKICTKDEQRAFLLLLVFPTVFIGVAGIRGFTEIEGDDYYWPCNNNEIIPTSEVEILNDENEAYEKIIKKYERPSSRQFSPELKSIKNKMNDVQKKLKLQNCYRQKCAKINIEKNMEEIKDKILSISIWLFRIAAVLLLLSGILCYYKRNFLSWNFGIIVFIFVSPTFFNAFLSLYDFFAIQKFEIKC